MGFENCEALCRGLVVGVVFLGDELWGEFTILLGQVLFLDTLLHGDCDPVGKTVLEVRNNSM